MKKLIFTFIFDDHDTLKEPNIFTDGWDYFCISDNDRITKNSNTWKYLKPKFDDLSISCPKKRSSNILTKYFDYFDETYDVIISIGGQMIINCNLDKFLNDYNYNNNVDILIPKHPQRSCIYEEAKAVIDSIKDSPEKIKDHIEFLTNKNYPKNNGLHATGVIVINNNEKVRNFYKLWNFNYNSFPTRRDQLSFDYSLWEYDQPIKILDPTYNEIFIEKKYFIIEKHNRLQRFK